ncbi:hypothetical protein BS78_01G021100 [Paspalum vaginatum]|nr:hypothetical protein BS78_01G021100 [Paspalum vaginatum]
MAASGSASLRGLALLLAVSISLWGAVAALDVKETCKFTAHPDWCEKAMNKLVTPDGKTEAEAEADGSAAPAPAPAPTST